LKVIEVDTKHLFKDLNPGGIERKEVESFWPKGQRALWNVQTKRNRGELPFLDLPYRKDIEEILENSKDLSLRFDPVVVLGIGGSCLAPQAIAHFVFHPWMLLESKAGPNGPKVFFLDNVDPSTCQKALEEARGGNPLVLAISKSGSTLETLSQLLLFLKALKDHFQDWKERLVIITDPKKGPLRELAEQEGLRSFPIEEGVVGRYSALSAVGLVPSVALGINAEELLLGAIEADRWIREEEGGVALEVAMSLFLLHKNYGKPIWITLIYGDGLFPLGFWRNQLVGESLGKREDLAPTPMVSRGTTDQHSQLQLWLEGPKDKVFTVLGLKEYPSLKLPEEFPRDETCCLWGKEMGEILLSEKRATEFVLEEKGCPFYRINLQNSIKALGALFFLWELEVLLLGEFYGIDPLTQPAVERGKRLTWGILGRKGFEKERKEIESWEK